MKTISIGGMGRLAAAAAAMAAAAMAAVAGGQAIEDVPRQRGPQRVETRQTYRKSAKLNRSRHWPFAETYKQARGMSPSSRPVR